MLRRTLYIFTFLLLAFAARVLAQCPVNSGFETGTFANWEGYTGTIDNDGNAVYPNQGIVPGLHTIISRASQQKDQYAQFPLVSPNGSTYVAMLGNDSHGGGINKAQKLTYTFTVPKNNNNFSFIYYYAVVIEDPPADNRHTVLNKPKFTASVYNVTDNKVTDCANFNFVAISSLPGFGAATVQTSAKDVYYKAWSPVTVDLRGYAGKTLRMEFTTNNCAPGGHFAYAYIDINQNCTSPVSGNYICDATGNTLTLKAPEGFEAYEWFTGRDFSKVIGTQSTLPVPATLGAQYSVIIHPFPGLGCQDTITTTIMSSLNLALNVKSSITKCSNQSVSLRTPDITAGSDSSYVFDYYNDAACTDPVLDPDNIIQSGFYYIKATPPSECFVVKKISINNLPSPKLVVHNPPEVCQPLTVDITLPYITAGSTLLGNSSAPTYWLDSACTKPVAHPEAIAVSNTYYLKTVNSNNGCADIKSINVLVNNLPALSIHNIKGCNYADLTNGEATFGSQNVARYTYWTDAQCTIELTHPEKITKTGTYYIRATTTAGCYVTSPVRVKISPYPTTVVNDPPSVIFPATVDITHSFVRHDSTMYSFFIDSLGQHLVPDPTKISVRGTYYIQAIVDSSDCAKMFAVHVYVLPPAVVDYGVNTFTPNGDGNNDIFKLNLTKAVRMNHFRVYNSWGALLFETTDYLKGWDGTSNGKKMPAGTYYWIMDGYDLYQYKPIQKSGSVTIVM